MAGWLIPPLVFLFAYLVGGISPGYWLVRWKTGSDVRTQGSGSTGATNTGRVLGKAGFALVLLLDAAKGALAVAGTQWINPHPFLLATAAVAVVAGHIWPPQLGWRGGKGIAPMMGAWLILAPLALLPCLVLGLLLLPWWRRMTLAGLGGLTLLPLSAWWAAPHAATLGAGVLTLALCLYSHRQHLAAAFAGRTSPAKSESAPPSRPTA